MSAVSSLALTASHASRASSLSDVAGVTHREDYRDMSIGGSAEVDDGSFAATRS